MSYFLLFNDCLQNYQSQNGVTSLQIFKNLPQNWDTFMHTVQKSAPKLRHVYAPRAKVSPKSEACLCTPCKSLP